MLKPSPYAWISQYFIGFFFAYGVYLPFWALWLKDQGISAGDIGILLGLAFATRCVANLVITPRIHKVEHLIPTLRILSVASAFFIAFHLVTGGNFWLLVVATILFNLCCGPAIPLSDALTNYYSRLRMLDYGRTRLWGSIAFILGSTVVGFLVAQFGIQMIVFTALFGVLLSIALSLRSPTTLPVTAEQNKAVRPRLSLLMRDRAVIKFLILVALIQCSHAAYYGFSSIYWKDAGYSADVIGYLWSLGVAAEVCIFALSNRLFGGWTLRSLFLVASVGVVIRWGLTASTTLLPALVFIQMLHGVTFALAHIAAIRYIQNSEPNRMVALQALYNAIPLGIVMAAMTTLSGWGYEYWGVNIFWGMALMGVVAMFIKLKVPQSEESHSEVEPTAQKST
ncbi:3-phenylpropionate MFS transporter [Vibrio gallicus]|uniref:3-phenylpropionate MFS transporter n=1 Tax=Vibrio gallicus TaxID=190897 RepID=UPI0021C45333|nr:3-phenylpropionate MFS transporter [Vibrio gallicus]